MNAIYILYVDPKGFVELCLIIVGVEQLEERGYQRLFVGDEKVELWVLLEWFESGGYDLVNEIAPFYLLLFESKGVHFGPVVDIIELFFLVFRELDDAIDESLLLNGSILVEM